MGWLLSRVVVVAVLGLAACVPPQAASQSESPAASAQVHDRSAPVAAAEGPTIERPKWCQGDVSTRAGLAVPTGSTLTDINVNGDDALEIFARHDCKLGAKCAHSVFAACGDGSYARIASGLEADRLETSQQGTLVGDVYWRDILAYEFRTLGDNLGEDRTRYRYDGSQYVRHDERGVARAR